jgi:hypothetical protein
MNNQTFYLPSSRLPVQALLVGIGLLICGPANAQNLLKNGDFEQRLGATNWTVHYLFGGESDFEIQNRIRGASRYPQGSATRFFGGCFRPLTVKLAHAFFSQTVTNLTPGHVYQFEGSMREDWWKSAAEPLTNKLMVFMEIIGGQGTPLPDGRFSMIATNDFTDSDGNANTDINPPYTLATGYWRPYYTQQVPDTNGRIEVRMHYNKVDFAIYDKTWTSAAYFDDIYLTP